MNLAEQIKNLTTVKKVKITKVFFWGKKKKYADTCAWIPKQPW